MRYKVIEIIEMDRDGNKKQNEIIFNTYNQTVFHIKQRMKEIIKQDTLKFFRKYNHKITVQNLNKFSSDEFKFWLEESEKDQFSYVAGCLGWGCFWMIEKAD